jgi:hypothetical protein
MRKYCLFFGMAKLIVKIRKMKKSKFGRIDSWKLFIVPFPKIGLVLSVSSFPSQAKKRTLICDKS